MNENVLKVSDIMDILEKISPKAFAEEWDNPGLSVGDPNAPVKRVVTALDLTDDVLEEAISLKADMIVTHHPLIFGAVKNVTAETPLGRRISKLIKNDIAAFSAHTNLDKAKGGTNDTLCELLGLESVEEFAGGIARIGILKEEKSLLEVANRLKKGLRLTSARVTGPLDKKIKKIGLCTGAGFDCALEAKALGAELFITGDIRYHEAQRALEAGLCLIDATHYASENIIAPKLKEYIETGAKALLKDVEVFVSQTDGQTFKDI